MKLTDTSPMPFGLHRGTPMQDVPVSYLHWLWHQLVPNSSNTLAVKEYIEENLNALRMENKDLLWDKK